MADTEKGGSVSFGVEGGARGSLFTNVYVERPMTGYILNDSDLRALLLFNIGAAIMFSLGSLAIGVSINWFIEWSMKKTAGAQQVAVTLAIVAAIFYALGIVLVDCTG
jgi:hypothetical protein